MYIQYGHIVDNTVEENSSIFSLIRMFWLLSARACRQLNFATTKFSSSLLEVTANAGRPVMMAVKW